MKYAGMPMGMCVLMKELGLYDLTPALCRLDYTMSEAGAATNFVICHAQRSKNHTPSRIARKIRLDRVNSPKYCFFPCGSSRAICR